MLREGQKEKAADTPQESFGRKIMQGNCERNGSGIAEVGADDMSTCEKKGNNIENEDIPGIDLFSYAQLPKDSYR